MAINKNNYLDSEGNYDFKKALVDELIDGVNDMADLANRVSSLEQNLMVIATEHRSGNLKDYISSLPKGVINIYEKYGVTTAEGYPVDYRYGSSVQINKPVNILDRVQITYSDRLGSIYMGTITDAAGDIRWHNLRG